MKIISVDLSVCLILKRWLLCLQRGPDNNLCQNCLNHNCFMQFLFVHMVTLCCQTSYCADYGDYSASPPSLYVAVKLFKALFNVSDITYPKECGCVIACIFIWKALDSVITAAQNLLQAMSNKYYDTIIVRCNHFYPKHPKLDLQSLFFFITVIWLNFFYSKQIRVIKVYTRLTIYGVNQGQKIAFDYWNHFILLERSIWIRL